MKLPSLSSIASGLRPPPQVAAIAGVVLLIVALAAILIRWGDRLPPALLWAIMAILLVGVLLWLVLRGWPLWREWRFLRHYKQEFGEAGAADPEPRRDLRLAAADALSTLKGLDPTALQRLPWLFMLGDGRAGRALLAHAARKSPLPSPDHGAHPGRLWHHWFPGAGVVVELADRFICARTDAATRRLWLEALLTSDRLRPDMPLHGLLLLIPVESLSPAAEETRQDLVVNLRRMIDELLRTLVIDIPVYVLVSGADRLEGAETFLTLLPEEVRSQAVGHAFAEGVTPDAALAVWTGAFDALTTTLYRLQLGLLAKTDTPTARQAIHAFTGQVERLREPLGSLLTSLFEAGPVQLQRTARLRGVYLVGGADIPAFAHDLFATLVPRDAPLARSTGGRRQRRRRLALITGVAALALSILATAAILWPVPALEAARQQASQACLDRAGTGGLAGLTHCAESIAAFDAAATAMPLGSRPARTQMAALRQAWVTAWHASVAEGLYNAMKQDIDHGTGFGVRLAVLESLSLLENCAGTGNGCTHDAPGTAELRTRLTYLGLDPGRLLKAHLSYLSWRPEADRVADRARLVSLRDQGWTTAPPSVADLLAWAGGLGKPRPLSSFWDQPMVEDSQPLGGAFTAEAWTGGIGPALDLVRASAGNPALADQLARDFHRARQEAWGDFLARFGEGAALWVKDPAGLKNLLANRNRHPFETLWRDLQAAVFATTPEDQFRPWARALKEALVSQWPNASTRLFALANQLAQAKDGQAGYELAVDAFKAGGAPSAKASAPLWQAAEQFSALHQKLEGGEQDDFKALTVLEAAPRTLLRLAMQDASVRVNEEWSAQILSKSRSQPPAQAVAQLSGEQGDLARFIKDWLSGFLVEGSTRPKTIMETEMPVDPVFTAFAERVRQPGEVPGPVPAGTLSVTAATRIGQITEGPQGTQVEMLCNHSIFTATSPGMTMPRRVNLSWKRDDCKEIRITVSLPTELGRGEPLLISRSWTGGDDLLERFARDFTGGRRSFPLSAFDQGGLTAEVRQRLHETAGPDATVTVAAEIQLEPGFNKERPGPPAVPTRVIQPVL